MIISLRGIKNVREIIAKLAKELHDGDVVNLGIGMPTWLQNYVSDDIDVVFQSENGCWSWPCTSTGRRNT